MFVAALVLSALSPDVPRFAFTFDATDTEREVALRFFGDRQVLSIAQIQIGRAFDGSGYTAHRPTWECAPVVAPTLGQLAAKVLGKPCYVLAYVSRTDEREIEAGEYLGVDELGAGFFDTAEESAAARALVPGGVLRVDGARATFVLRRLA